MVRATIGVRFTICSLTTLLALCSYTYATPVETGQFERDYQEVLSIPPLSNGKPSAGKRVKLTPPEYAGTNVFHTIYLPKNWDASGEQLPIVFEYTGNYHPPSGSSGEPEDAALGFGLSGGKFIWVSLPYVSSDHSDNAVTWWGDEEATIAYAKANVPRIIEAFNADSEAVILCGFSRGAIAVNYIGLHDDEIASYWTAFVTHDHFDGVREWSNTKWGTPLQEYRSGAIERLHRVGDRPYFVSQHSKGLSTRESAAETLLRSALPDITNFSITYVDIERVFGAGPREVARHVHTDRWLLLPSPYRNTAWKWVNDVTEE